MAKNLQGIAGVRDLSPLVSSFLESACINFIDGIDAKILLSRDAKSAN